MDVYRTSELIVLVITTAVFIFTLVINYLQTNKEVGRDFGFKDSVGDVSDKYSLLVTPAGWTFSIWGLIYLWLAAWLCYGWSFVFRPAVSRSMPLLVFVLFTLSCVLNVGWLYAFSNEEFGVALALLIVLALILYGTLGVAAWVLYWKTDNLKRQSCDIMWTLILQHNGLAVYATWTTIATLLNVGVVMQYTGSRVKANAVALTVLIVLMVLQLGWFVVENVIIDSQFRYVLTIYPVVIWALAGALSKESGDHKEVTGTIIAALVLACLLLAARIGCVLIGWFFRKIKYPSVAYRKLHS